MSGDVSLEYWSRETIHYYPHHHNDNGISYDESVGVSAGDGRRGYMSLETSKYYSHNSGVYRSGDQSGYDGRGGYRSQETINSSSINSV